MDCVHVVVVFGPFCGRNIETSISIQPAVHMCSRMQALEVLSRVIQELRVPSDSDHERANTFSTLGLTRSVKCIISPLAPVQITFFESNRRKAKETRSQNYGIRCHTL